MSESAAARISQAIRNGDASAGHVWLLALPVVAENLLAMLVGWSDTIITGQILGEDHFLAAITVASYLLWLIESCGALIASGAQAIVARLIGGRDDREANQIVTQSLLLAGALGLLLASVVFLSADGLVTVMRLEGEARALASEYLRIIAGCCPLMMILLVSVTCLRAAGHTLAGMWIITAVNLINIVCSWALTIGIGPIPGLGWRGVAAGTAISFSAGGLIALARLWRGYAELRLPRVRPLPDFRRFRRILRIGIPGAANSIAMVLCQLWYIAIISHLGNAAVAAHGVAIRCESISWFAADAFAIAAATLVGQSLGARRPTLARQYGWIALRVGTAFLSLLGVVFYTCAPWLFAIFVRTEESQVLTQGIPVLQLIAFAMPALAASIILTGAVRGAGDTRWPFVYNTLGFLCVRIPLAYALTDGWLSLGLYGAWIAMVIDLYARGSAALARFLSTGWTNTRV